MTASEQRREVSLGCHVFRELEPVSRFVVELERLDHGDLILRRNGERLMRALERA